MTWQTTLRSRDLAKIGQIAYPIHRSMGLAIEILWYQSGKISRKIKGEITIWTFSDLWPISRSGQRSAENFIPKIFRAECKYHGMNEFWPSLPGTSQFVHSFVHFVSTFSVIFQWQHDIFCHTSWYELLGPWPIFPPSFIEISWKMSEISPLSNYYCGDSNYY